MAYQRDFQGDLEFVSENISAQSGMRVLDIAVAGAALIIFSPLFLAIAIAVIVDSGFPILYRQRRIGKNGHIFEILKFRKFYKDVGNGSPLTAKNDSRMTPLGRVLARTKLDELPQLINVLRGEMSIVGPRPESLAFADCYTGAFRRLLAYKPGIFGPAQIVFRNESSRFPAGVDPATYYRDVLFGEKALIDLDYYARRTPMSDLWILANGVLSVFISLPPPEDCAVAAGEGQRTAGND